MKKILYFIVTILEAALLIGTYVVNSFTVKKLGMVRWVNFHGMAWEKTYPIAQIKIAVIVLILVLSILVLCLYLKQRKNLKKIVGAMTVVTVLVSAGCIGYILMSSFATMRAYYLICMLLVVTAVLQFLKNLVGILMCHNEK